MSKARRRQARSHPARARLQPAEPQARQRAEQTQLPLPRPPAKHRTKHSEAPGGEDRAETQPAEAQTAGQLSKRCVSTKQSSKGAAGAKAGSAAPVALAGPWADITLLPAPLCPGSAVPTWRRAASAGACCGVRRHCRVRRDITRAHGAGRATRSYNIPTETGPEPGSPRRQEQGSSKHPSGWRQHRRPPLS